MLPVDVRTLVCVCAKLTHQSIRLQMKSENFIYENRFEWFRKMVQAIGAVCLNF